ncbi:hypothetical protein E2C01_094511 [Portunus trituberculatus]|uniref:Uncharacterized protein n=1 Tax=Portunus trituberculatus TaxID=210409 RepID=A0A5B7K3D7_PORTR|nr:hypothetical protein [Portunus trituberculatus]
MTKRVPPHTNTRRRWRRGEEEEEIHSSTGTHRDWETLAAAQSRAAEHPREKERGGGKAMQLCGRYTRAMAPRSHPQHSQEDTECVRGVRGPLPLVGRRRGEARDACTV